MAIRVVVADDHDIVLSGVVLLLAARPGIEVVGQCANGEEAVELTRRLEPDVVVMDIQMPGLGGIEATRLIAQERADGDHLTKVLVLTTFSDDEIVYGALRAGASGLVLKRAGPQDLAAAIEHVASGNAWLDPRVAGAVINAMASEVRYGDPTSVLIHLTPREIEILRVMADGLDNGQIAERFVLSEATVRTHVSRVITKTGSRDRTQAVVLAYRLGLVVVDRRPGRPWAGASG